jgi:PAS domain S-box-containing protein
MNPRILIIDDNLAIHDDFRKILCRHRETRDDLAQMESSLFGLAPNAECCGHFELDCASQGEEGLTLLRQAMAEGRPYALAFIDGRMPPGWDGVETIRHLRQESPDLQMVLCTAYADYSWQEIQRELGQTDSLLILKKPFDNIEVLQLTHTLTKKWQLNREVRKQITDLDALLARTRGTEEALRKSEKRFRRMFEQAAEGILICDEQSLIQDANPRALSILGFSRDELLEIPLRELVHPDDLAVHSLDRSWEFLLAGEVVNTERRFRRQDGSWLPVQISAILFQDHGVNLAHMMFQDITVRKHFEAESRVLRQAVENAPISVVITDTDGTMIYVNPYFTKITGYCAQEAIGQNPRMLKSGQHDEAFYRNLWGVISSGQTWRGEMLNKNRDGTLFWESASISPIFDDRGRITHFIGVKEDIGGKKDLERLKEDVDRIMRHDLKTPLNAIIGFPQFILQSPNLSADQRDMILAIEDSGRRLLAMINLSLDLLKMEKGNYEYRPEAVDLIAILFKLSSQNRTILISKNIEFTITVNGSTATQQDSFFIYSEESLLYSLFANLLKNATEASPLGEAIQCEIRHNGEMRLTLTNKGAVPEQIRGHFFEKYKTFGKSSGTGLGTYSAQLMATSMGYRLDMETSDTDNCTRLTLTVPGSQTLQVSDMP